MFLRLHAARLENWNPQSSEFFAFLTLSSYGFKCRRNGEGDAISSWPIVSTIFNYSPQERIQASNCLIHAIIPSNHDPEYFDTLLSEIAMDLKHLKKGLSTYFYYGRIRKLRAFVMNFTAYWLAASKLLGYVGHNGRLLCRFCLKEWI